MSARLFIQASNIHQGGGRTLLSALLSTLPDELETIAVLDTRMKIPESMKQGIQIRWVKPSVLQRFKAELWLAKNVQPHDVVLCLGNLPPLFKLQGHVTVFLQNRYLVEMAALTDFPLRTRLRFGVERLWFSGKTGNANEFIVQTPSMKMVLLSSGCVAKQPVHVRPFADMPGGYQRTVNHGNVWQQDKRYDFVYIASGDPHKNHRRLIDAWCLLAREGLFPSLCLTVDKENSMELCAWMEKQKLHYGLKLDNLGFLPYAQVLELYSQVKALIYPSTLESFGLPLIEARRTGLPVLAPELDYVRDVLDPEQTFDPESPVSIVRAVKRFMGLNDEPLALSNGNDFIRHVMNKGG